MESKWVEVDKLIHELGAVRSFVDEADPYSEAETASPVAGVRSAMAEATDAISLVFTDERDSVLAAAWKAIARAQDAVVRARAVVAEARAARGPDRAIREHAQHVRVRQHAQTLTDQTLRLRGRWLPEQVGGSSKPDRGGPHH